MRIKKIYTPKTVLIGSDIFPSIEGLVHLNPNKTGVDEIYQIGLWSRWKDIKVLKDNKPR